MAFATTRTAIVLMVVMLCLVMKVAVATSRHHYDHRRHLLHQPFFPLTTTPPPSLPPALSPQQNGPLTTPPPPAQPKYPFSTTPPNSLQKPFFPVIPSPPPPPSPTTLITFPANISSLLFPHPSSPASHRRVVLTLSISLSLLILAIFAAVSAFVVRTRRTQDKKPRTDSLRLVPPNTIPSDTSPKPPKLPHRPGVSNSSSSEFLYLGTLVNSRNGVDEVHHQQKLVNLSNVGLKIGTLSSSSTSPNSYHKLGNGSPELRPLPPLPRSNTYTPTFRSGEVLVANERDLDGLSNADRRDYDGLSTAGEEGEEGEEEFFSPRGSSGRRESNVRICVGSSSSRREFQEENFGSRSFNSRTASYPHSNSVSPIDSMSSSPSQVSNSSRRSLKSDKNGDSNNKSAHVISFHNVGSVSLSSLSSGNTHNSPEPSSGSFGRNHESLKGNVEARRLVMPSRLPPPPPPLPPARFWEIPERVRVVPEVIVTSSGPPVLVAPSRPVLVQNGMLSNEQLQNNGGSGEKGEETTPKPKLKPLHWDKVRASSDRVMVWDQIKSSSFQLNEEMIETLFMVNNSNLNPKENNGRRQSLPMPNPENRVLDPKKSQNIAILLRALNVTIDEVCEALLEGNSDTLGTELLESLLKMAPTKEEEHKLKEFKDESPFKLGPAEKFLKAVLDIPFAFQRVDAMLYFANFDSEVEYLRRSFETLEVACGELKNSRMFLKLLEAVLMTGNRMNVGTNRGDAHAFKLDTLLKLVDVKGTDGKTTLLHFVVQEIIRTEGSRLSSTNQNQTAEKDQFSSLHDDAQFRKLGLQVVAGLSGELSNVKKAAAMDSDVLSSEVSKLASGITKIGQVLKLNEEIPLKESSRKFSESMITFSRKAEEEIVSLQAQEKVALSLVKEITEYFHGNSAKEEAHPFRIFMVVRDFLSILDNVCKEVGKINERTIYSSVRPLPTISNLPPVFPGLNGRQNGFSDDETPSP